ncbi:MAG TPA: FHA domain-containing protein [Anaerolineae bacterium]|nr:FHA domain-containing protein [Anaerolineae bacterium]
MGSEIRLVMTKGPQPGQTFHSDQDLVMIGRAPTNDIVIGHPEVSRQHARLVRRGTSVVLEDLGSTNGTFVNGVRLTAPHALVNGDVISLGNAVNLTYYGPPGSTTEPVAIQPDTTVIPPPASKPEPSSTPTPYPPKPTPPPHQPATTQPKKRRSWLWIGCAVAVILIVVACVGIVVLDHLRLLPPIFYEPLRWLGFI